MNVGVSKREPVLWSRMGVGGCARTEMIAAWGSTDCAGDVLVGDKRML